MPWQKFSLRVAEKTLQDRSFNLTATLLAVASDGERLRGLQTALQVHAADVLYELPDSRVAYHFLRQARFRSYSIACPPPQEHRLHCTAGNSCRDACAHPRMFTFAQAHLAATKVCDRSLSLNTAPGISWERSAGRD